MTKGTAREKQLVRAFVELSDTLVGDYDVTDLLHDLVGHCVHLLQADAAGILLSDQRGGLQVMASSSEQTRLLELFQQQAGEGPCVDAITTGAPVSIHNLDDHADRWPAFVSAAHQQGFVAVDALPLRLRSEVIGTLNLFRTQPGPMPDADLHVAQALADTATIAILSERVIHHRGVLVAQLEGALNSRIIVEQAKGILVASGGIDMDHAFAALRTYARSTHSRLTEVAADLTTNTLSPTVVLTAHQPAIHQHHR